MTHPVESADMPSLWSRAMQVMFRACLAKFSQNAFLRGTLAPQRDQIDAIQVDDTGLINSLVPR